MDVWDVIFEVSDIMVCQNYALLYFSKIMGVLGSKLRETLIINYYALNSTI